MKQKVQKELFDKVFYFLGKRIGENVTCNYWQFGVLKSVTGNLNLVVPFDKISVDNVQIPFIAEHVIIETIYSNSKCHYIYGIPLRKNECNPSDFMMAALLQEEKLGYSPYLASMINKSKSFILKK